MTNRRFDKNLYEVLGVEATATPEELKQAYRRRAREEHPDTKKTDEEKQAATVRFQELNEAYEILSDPQRRTEYDHRQSVEAARSGFWDQQSYDTYTDDEKFRKAEKEFEQRRENEEQEAFHKYRYKWEFGIDERFNTPEALLFITPEDSTNVVSDTGAIRDYLRRYRIHFNYHKSYLDENDELQFVTRGKDSRSVYIEGKSYVKKLRKLIDESYNPFEQSSSIIVSDNSPENDDESWQQGLKKRAAVFATAVAVAAIGLAVGYWIGNQISPNRLPHHPMPDPQEIPHQKNAVKQDIEATRTTLAGLETVNQQAPSLEQLQHFGGVALGKKGLRALHASPKETIKAVNETFDKHFTKGKQVKNFIATETAKKYQELDTIRGVTSGTTWQEFDKIANTYSGENVFQKGKQRYEQHLKNLQQQENNLLSPQSYNKDNQPQTFLQKFSAVGQSIATTISNGWHHLQEQSTSWLAQMQQQIQR